MGRKYEGRVGVDSKEKLKEEKVKEEGGLTRTSCLFSEAGRRGISPSSLSVVRFSRARRPRPFQPFFRQKLRDSVPL